MFVFPKKSKNADQQGKWFLKICKWQKVVAKTNLSPKNGQFSKGDLQKFVDQTKKGCGANMLFITYVSKLLPSMMVFQL